MKRDSVKTTFMISEARQVKKTYWDNWKANIRISTGHQLWQHPGNQNRTLPVVIIKKSTDLFHCIGLPFEVKFISNLEKIENTQGVLVTWESSKILTLYLYKCTCFSISFVMENKSNLISVFCMYNANICKFRMSVIISFSTPGCWT